jgi:predicted DNA-binding ribbon-helix-helix protein
MARLSRPLKTAFWDDDKVCHLSRDARLTLAGLITKMADDEGRFIASPGRC